MEAHDDIVAWLDLVRVGSIVRAELDRAMERAGGIGISEGEVLYQLSCAPEGGLRMTDLAGSLGMAQSSITRVVDRLVERGYVTRETRPSNRRTIDARITREGMRLFERLRPVYIGVIKDRFASGLTPEDASNLRCVLRSVLESLGAREEVPWERRPRPPAAGS